MVEYPKVFDKLEELSDLETAVLLGVVAGEHCIIDTEQDVLDELENELKLIAANTFGLTHAAITCSPQLSPEEFSNAIFVQDASHWPRGRQSSSSLLNEKSRNSGSPSLPYASHRGKSRASTGANYRPSTKLANVVIAKDLDRASEDVQMRAVELICSNRNAGPDNHGTPDTFVFIALLSCEGKPLSTVLNRHLNDHIFVSHYHDPNDGFANLEQSSEWLADAQRSASPASWKTCLSSTGDLHTTSLDMEDIRTLRRSIDSVILSPDINCYMQNIVIFLRLNRAVFSGVSPTATRHFKFLAKCLAPLQHMDYVCPSLVAAAAKKVYRHRIVIPRPEDDRSMQYGSTFKAVEALLADATPENTIERVLAEVEVPL